ncbi:sorting nexin-22 isoform X1 [Mycteria americana]|uniref:sorting nexin-22 isoform X1 n=1 Tax=Mycteria americana TaxID=33587 RepID=UPI003F5889F7
MIAVSIPAAEPQAAARSPDKAHTVFRVEVLCNGRRHTVAKRYSEFQALHKRIKKTCKVPDFPPRRVPNWMPKVLEQRRQGLELYIQGVLYHNEELPQDVLDFLKVRRCQQDPKASSPPTGHLPSQRPVVGFCTDPYVQPPDTGKKCDHGCRSPKPPRGKALLGPQNIFFLKWGLGGKQSCSSSPLSLQTCSPTPSSVGCCRASTSPCAAPPARQHPKPPACQAPEHPPSTQGHSGDW